MDSLDNPHTNLPARLPATALRVPVQAPLATRELASATPTSTINPWLLLRGLKRHWWKILLIWVVLSTLLDYAVWRLVEPVYLASSQLLIDSNQPELFDHGLMSRDGSQPSYLQSEIELMRTDTVLELALNKPGIAQKPMIKGSLDAVADLRSKLIFQILPNTHWVRVALESKDPEEASAIVNAVVDSYEQISADTGLTGSTLKSGPAMKKTLIDGLKVYEKKYEDEIKATKDKLIAFAEKGTVELSTKSSDTKNGENDPKNDETQSVFNKESLDLYKTAKEHLMQTEFQIMELEARYEAKQSEQTPAGSETESPVVARNEDLRAQVTLEFKRDPEVASIIEQIKATTDQLEHTKGVVRKGADPARIAASRQLASLKKTYEDLWKTKSEEIQQRLLVPTSASVSPELESLTDIKRKLESLKNTQTKLVKIVDKFKVEKQASQTDAVKAAFDRDDLNRAYNMYDVVHRKLEALHFSEGKASTHVDKIEQAKVPQVANSNKRSRFMVILPVGVLFGIMGIFLLLELRSERVGDPDALSNRVQSEVFALPPLPTPKLSGPVLDEQIERFIQRLDHLRFAVCGDHHETEMGRCVLVTSAVGGEGKTTLAAQLAARCGNAGISTLLIDADVRKASLCTLLDIPEGAGLSDVLEGAKPEDVIISVQGGTFDLLAAGTPVQDTSRILQGRSFAMLIAQMRQRYQLIFIDSPPILPVPDALILGRWADGALLAARFEVSRSPQVERARRQLDSAGIPVLGTVINGLRSSDAYYGRYSYDRQRTPAADPSSPV